MNCNILIGQKLTEDANSRFKSDVRIWFVTTNHLSLQCELMSILFHCQADQRGMCVGYVCVCVGASSHTLRTSNFFGINFIFLVTSQIVKSLLLPWDDSWDGFRNLWLVHLRWLHKIQFQWNPDWQTSGNKFHRSDDHPWLEPASCALDRKPV